MAGGETPKGRRGPERFSRVWWLEWLLLAYTLWAVVAYVSVATNPQVAIIIGVGLCGMAVLATRRADERG